MDKKIILYIALGIVILLLLLFTLYPGMIYAIKDSGKSGTDICQPPAGSSYTEESWREHMSHHPNIYKQCLG